MTQAVLRFDAAEGRRRRDRGIRAASAKHSAWLVEAREVAVSIARTTGTVNADDLRAAGIVPPQGASPNVFGGIFKDDRFAFYGYTHSARPEAHGNLISQWTLVGASSVGSHGANDDAGRRMPGVSA